LLDQREQDLRRGRVQLNRLMEVFRESSAVGRPDSLVELVSGPEAIDTRARRLFDSARSQIRAFDWPPYLQTPGANLDYESRRLREGITYRILYSRDALAWPGRYRADIAAGCAAGEQARVRGTLPTKLVLADSHFALLPAAGADTPADLAYAIRAPALLAALSALFEGEWERGIPLAAAAAGDEPDETSRGLLQLLAAGLTDTAIARELDWSPRTTQRRVKDLFDRLGVATRFQAGVVARDRGWL
jgi:DNA-binding CsgD family transcriptional regulator